MSALLASLAITLVLGIFAGLKLVRARAYYRDSKWRSLGYVAPVIFGAILVYMLVQADPFDVYLPGLYLFGVGAGFLPSTLDSSRGNEVRKLALQDERVY
jgi:hypothetical protein